MRKLFSAGFKAAFLLVSVGLPDAAQATLQDYRRGNGYLSMCHGNIDRTTGNEITEEVICVAYTQGVADGLINSGAATNKFAVCFPNEVNEEQLEAIGVKYIRDHPDTRHLFTGGLLTHAWEAVFPCPKPKTAK